MHDVLYFHIQIGLKHGKKSGKELTKYINQKS